jgi:hypothetical protein
MHLTPAQCAAVYDCLREFRPFNRWHLPPADAVKFRLVQRLDIYAQYVHAPGPRHIITMSSAKIGHLNTLVRCMGHEMIHLAQAVSGDESRAQHNADFYRRARLVSTHLGWDPKEL